MMSVRYQNLFLRNYIIIRLKSISFIKSLNNHAFSAIKGTKIVDNPQYREILEAANMPVTIYKTDLSPPARAVLMTAEFLKLKYETKEVNVLAGETLKPEYIAKNPLHTVPLLEDGDFVLADSHAIITYLASKYGADIGEELYPSDLASRATINQRLFFDATILFPALRLLVNGILKDKTTEPTEVQKDEVNKGYAVLEAYLQKTRFVALDYLTLADISVVATVSSLNALVPIDTKYEKVHTWLSRVEDEEWYVKANVSGLKQFGDLLKMVMEKNKA